VTGFESAEFEGATLAEERLEERERARARDAADAALSRGALHAAASAAGAAPRRAAATSASAAAGAGAAAAGAASPLQKFGTTRCKGADAKGRWIRLDAETPCAPPYCTGDRRRSVSAMDWSGATRHWVFVPFTCYYHLYSIQEAGCCAADRKVLWSLIMGDSPIRELFGNLLNFNGTTERYAKFDAIDAVAGLPPPMRLTFQFWHSSFFMSSEYEALRGGSLKRSFAMDRAYLDHFNVLPSRESGKPWRVPGLQGHSAPMREPAKGAEHLFSGVETDEEATRPDVFIANGALAYEALYNSLETNREWSREFTQAVGAALRGDASLGAKGKPMRAMWARGPAINGQPHGMGESITLARASQYDDDATAMAREAGWEVFDAREITQTRWEDYWDGLHLLREANGDWKGLTSAMVAEAFLNAVFKEGGEGKCGGGC
jgi:hypothetical protein